ncbi:MAG: hypothetical protein J5685_07475 [Clostridiales bacterium]|nr:hypothetical protein [Clostridiales bacterium]
MIELVIILILMAIVASFICSFLFFFMWRYEKKQHTYYEFRCKDLEKRVEELYDEKRPVVSVGKMAAQQPQTQTQLQSQEKAVVSEPRKQPFAAPASAKAPVAPFAPAASVAPVTAQASDVPVTAQPSKAPLPEVVPAPVSNVQQSVPANRPSAPAKTGGPADYSVEASEAARRAGIQPMPAQTAAVTNASSAPSSSAAFTKRTPQAASGKSPYIAPPPKPPKQKISAVSVSFSIGVLLFVIAAAVFITTSWNMLGMGKCIIPFAVVGVVYALSYFCRKKLKLERTGSGMYILASLLVPLALTGTFIAFDLIGIYKYILLILCALSLGITGFIGYKVFKSGSHVALSFLGFVWSAIFICLQVFESVYGFMLGLAFASLVIAIVYYVRPNLHFFNIFTDVMSFISVVSFLISLFGTGNDYPVCLIAQVMFLATIILFTRKSPFVRYISPLIPLLMFTKGLWTIDGIQNGLDLPSNSVPRLLTSLLIVAAPAAAVALYRLLKHNSVVSDIIFLAGYSLNAWAAFIVCGQDVKDILAYTCLFVPVVLCGVIMFMTKVGLFRDLCKYLIFLALLIAGSEVLPGWIMPFTFLAVAFACMILSFRFKDVNITLASVIAAVIGYIIRAELFKGDTQIIDISLALLCGGFYCVLAVVNKFGKLDPKIYGFTRIASYVLAAMANLMILATSYTELPAFIALIVIDIVLIAVSLIDVNNFTGALPVLTLTAALLYRLQESGVDAIPVAFAAILIYTFAGRFLIGERVFTKKKVDWFTLVAAVFCFVGATDSPIFFWLLCAFYVLTFVGRFADKDSDIGTKIRSRLKVLLSIVTYLVSFFFSALYNDMCYDFNVIICVLIEVAAAFLVYFVICRHKATYWLMFATVALSVMAVGAQALSDNDLLSTTIVTVVGIGLFLYSFFARKRSWFIMSIATIVLIGVVFAFEFWDNKIWWVYLLVIGGILITTASINEFKRRKALEQGMEDKKIRLFDNWTW